MSADILRILVILLGIVVVAVILIQQPKEGGMGAFTGGGGGSGASSTVFGAKGSGSFFFKLTAGATLLFAILIIALVKVTNSDMGGSVLSASTAVEESVIPGQATTDDAQKAAETPLPKVVTPETNKSGSTTPNDEIPGAVVPNAQNNSEESLPGATQP
ncbi:MAG: preprotein translocase subunit SecG [Gammaproteobacteria bacterium]|nr:MAG: preprotein translocase subunit SecG [Gammaproteobacteria bacterium]